MLWILYDRGTDKWLLPFENLRSYVACYYLSIRVYFSCGEKSKVVSTGVIKLVNVGMQKGERDILS